MIVATGLQGLSNLLDDFVIATALREDVSHPLI